MTVDLFTRVILLNDIPAQRLLAQDVGTVVEQYDDSSGRCLGYEVEFFSASGETVAIVSLPPEAIRKPDKSDRLSIRVA